MVLTKHKPNTTHRSPFNGAFDLDGFYTRNRAALHDVARRAQRRRALNESRPQNSRSILASVAPFEGQELTPKLGPETGPTSHSPAVVI